MLKVIYAYCLSPRIGYFCLGSSTSFAHVCLLEGSSFIDACFTFIMCHRDKKDYKPNPILDRVMDVLFYSSRLTQNELLYSFMSSR
jgi:hypothetical protein